MIAGSTLGLPLVASNLWAMPQDWEPADWGEEQAQRVAAEVRRLRGKRSTQWLSDRTAEVGHRINRGTLADLENGRRRYVTITELIVLAAALSTAPIALLYPGPDYLESIAALPAEAGPPMPEIWAVNWFAGRPTHILTAGRESVPNFDDYERNSEHLGRAYVYDELTRTLNLHLGAVARLREEIDAGRGRPGDEQMLNGYQESIQSVTRNLEAMRARIEAAIADRADGG